MKEVKLQNSTRVALVDDEDYELVAGYRWYLSGPTGLYYATTDGWASMHRLINKTPKGMVTDHINRYGLDNRKSNLRSCTRSENQRNKQKLKSNKSGYIGVSWSKPVKKWRATARFNGELNYLGEYKDIMDAVRVRDEFVAKTYGEYGMLNLPKAENQTNLEEE